MRRLKIYLVASVVVVVAAIAATIVSGNSPVLGLDLKGGISVTYQPVGTPKSGALDETLKIINNRVNTFGVAEPSISRQGSDIVVELPGVKDQAKALRLVGRTAQLRFRPVLAQVPPVPATAATPKGGGDDHHHDPRRTKPPSRPPSRRATRPRSPRCSARTLSCPPRRSRTTTPRTASSSRSATARPACCSPRSPRRPASASPRACRAAMSAAPPPPSRRGRATRSR